MSSYYIDKFTYTRDDPDDYEIEVVSNSTDTYIIKKNDFYKD
jgi:hypothetical protein